MKKIIAVFLLLCGPFALMAEENPTFSFLRNDVSARAAAMAGSYVAMRNDINGMYYNPATLPVLDRPEASFGYFKHLMDINAGYASFAQELWGGTLGLGAQYVNYGSFDQTDELANTIGTFGAGDLALSASFAIPYDEDITVGATAKIIYSSIADAHSSAAAADIGILYSFHGTNPLTLGISVLNIGSQLNPYLDTRENLPFDVRIGAMIKPEHLPLQLGVSFQRLNESREDLISRFRSFSLGGEFTLSKPLRLRFGYDNERRRDLKIGTSAGMAGFSFGLGIIMKTIRIDYGYTSLGKIGSLNRISLGMDL
ncbi:MAG: type IX secretion system protein PorQ [Ignavibacteriales bacterium]|nr:type IX secretion system protein PorQ [Ignavibacteriales bacterium]